MEISQDYEDLFKIFNTYKVKFLVVGAYAVIYHTEPRYTKDIDVLVPPEFNEGKIVYQALKAFGTPLKGITPEDFQNEDFFLQIGVAPVRIDILTDISGISIKEAWKNKVKAKYGNTPINVLARQDLMKAKKKAGRPQDKIDLEKLIKWSKKK